MGNVLLVLADAADDVAVHDLHVVDVEEQLHVRRADTFDQIDAEIHVVTEVTGMPSWDGCCRGCSNAPSRG